MPKPTCSATPCERAAVCRGWCNAHYMRWLNGKPVDGPIKPLRSRCEIDGCDREHRARGYCELHYDRIRNHGSPDAPPRPAGDRHGSWVGDRATYNALHHRWRNSVGPASNFACDDCGSRALDWAYDHADPDEVVGERGLTYSLKFEHYRPLCRKCHIAFDRQMA